MKRCVAPLAGGLLADIIHVSFSVRSPAAPVIALHSIEGPDRLPTAFNHV